MFFMVWGASVADRVGFEPNRPPPKKGQLTGQGGNSTQPPNKKEHVKILLVVVG